MTKLKNNAVISLFIGGNLLLAVNFLGLIVPLRSNLIHNQSLYSNKTNDTIKLSDKEALKILHNIKTISDEESLRTATETVNKAILHYWDDELAKEFRLHIPPQENWILWLGGYIVPQYFSKYEFCYYWEKGIARGAGWCSQSAAILARLLETKNIEAKIYVMYRHVVVIAKINNKNYVADPDNGVVLPFDIGEIEKDPEIIRPFYKKAGHNEDVVKNIIRAFNISDEQKEKTGFIRHTNYCSKKHQIFEELMYIFKWLIPALFILPLAYNYAKKRYAKK